MKGEHKGESDMCEVECKVRLVIVQLGCQVVGDFGLSRAGDDDE